MDEDDLEGVEGLDFGVVDLEDEAAFLSSSSDFWISATRKARRFFSSGSATSSTFFRMASTIRGMSPVVRKSFSRASTAGMYSGEMSSSLW